MNIDLRCKLQKTDIQDINTLKLLIKTNITDLLCEYLAHIVIAHENKLSDISELSISVNPCLVNGYAEIDPAIAGQNGV